MSKKNRYKNLIEKNSRGISAPAPVSPQTEAGLVDEYRIIRSDLIRVIFVNALFLSGLLALYYTNQQSHYLERWFSGIIT